MKEPSSSNMINPFVDHQSSTSNLSSTTSHLSDVIKAHSTERVSISLSLFISTCALGGDDVSMNSSQAMTTKQANQETSVPSTTKSRLSTIFCCCIRSKDT